MFALKYRRLFRDIITISKYLKGFHATVERKQVKDLFRVSGREIVLILNTMCCICKLIID